MCVRGAKLQHKSKVIIFTTMSHDHEPFTAKSAIVQAFIDLLKTNRDGLIRPSARQLEVYDNLIYNLECAPTTISMKDVRARFIIAEDDMFCPCTLESDNKQYV